MRSADHCRPPIRYSMEVKRLLPALACLAGCLQAQPSSEPPFEPTSGWTGPQGEPITGCTSDTSCGSQVCARDGNCYPASSVRFVRAKWTVGGEPANSASCASSPDLVIGFLGTQGDYMGFAPVPCRAGQFNVDKLPIQYVEVELGIDNTGTTVIETIDANDEVHIDLP